MFQPSLGGISAMDLYNFVKYWMPLIGAAFGAFKGIQWVKEIRTKDIPDIKNSVSQIHTELQSQTTAVVSELKELRADMRAYVIATPKYAKAAASRRKKK